MKALGYVLLVVAVGAASAGATWWLMSSRRAPVEHHGPASSQPEAPPLIVTSQPSRRTFTRQVPWIGTVQSQASVRLVALVEGRVEAIEAKDQQPIEAEKPVMRLGGPQVESQRTQLQAGIDSLQAQAALAEQTVKRLEQDLKAQLTTKDQLAAAQESQLKTQAQLQAARLGLEAFKEKLDISAPVAGVFTARRVGVGQTVEPGQEVGKIIDPDNLRIVASLFPPPGTDLAGKEAAVRLDGSTAVAGIVRRVLPQADDSGATEVWIEGPSIDRQLKAGQTVGGTVTLNTQPSALAVPSSAIVYGEGEQPYVFIAEEGTYRQREVHLGLTQDGWVEVLSGLEPGQSVVSQGAYELFYRRFSQQFKVED